MRAKHTMTKKFVEKLKNRANNYWQTKKIS